MWNRLINAVTWMLVAGSIAIILGGLTGRPVFLAAVPTRSMTPLLTPGDLIPIVPVFVDEFKPGQVIVFRTETDRTWIVHRIISGNAHEGYVTKGDANAVADPNLVFPRHVAGVVPATNGRLWRVPKLGLLSLERNPLSNPLVAGLAMVAGTYLLISDLKLKSPKSPRRIRLPRMGVRAVAATYAGLAVSAFVVTVLAGWSLGHSETFKYNVVASQSTDVRQRDVLTFGSPKEATTTIRNSAPVPVIIGMQSSDPDLKVEPSWFLLGGGQAQQLQITIHAGELGQHKATLRRAVYFPLLPAPVLHWLSVVSWRLPLIVVGFVPVLAVAAIAAADTRVVHFVQSTRRRLQYRLWF